MENISWGIGGLIMTEAKSTEQTENETIGMDEETFLSILEQWNELTAELRFGYDMKYESFLSILKAWDINAIELFNFITENGIEVKVLKKMMLCNRKSPLFMEEVIIHGLEEMVRCHYRQGKTPKGFRVKNGNDPFYIYCKNKGKITLPIIPRPNLLEDGTV